MTNTHQILYTERLTSNKTSAAFAALALIFAGLAFWRSTASGLQGWAVILACFAIFFLFYLTNYRTLVIQLSSSALTLKFGFLRWTIPLENIAQYRLDPITGLTYYGGAGVHFMTVAGRYRVSFNFLEHPRVVIALKRKVGPVRDVSFSTRYPEDLLRHIQSAGEKLQNIRQ